MPFTGASGSTLKVSVFVSLALAGNKCGGLGGVSDFFAPTPVPDVPSGNYSYVAKVYQQEPLSQAKIDKSVIEGPEQPKPGNETAGDNSLVNMEAEFVNMEAEEKHVSSMDVKQDAANMVAISVAPKIAAVDGGAPATPGGGLGGVYGDLTAEGAVSLAGMNTLNVEHERFRVVCDRLKGLETSGDTDVDAVKHAVGQAINCKDANGNTLLVSAAAEGLAGTVKGLLEAYNFDAKDMNTALVVAVRKNYAVVVQTLLVRRASAVVANNTGKTALMVAADENCQGAAKVLLRSRAEVQVVDNLGNTALDFATPRSGIMKLLRTSCNRQLPLPQKQLMKAVMKGDQTDAVVEALGNNADVNYDKYLDGKAVLMVAVARGSMKVAQLLLKSDADVGARDKTHRTPLMLAAKTDRVDVVELLLERRANVLSADNTEKLCSWSRPSMATRLS